VSHGQVLLLTYTLFGISLLLSVASVLISIDTFRILRQAAKIRAHTAQVVAETQVLLDEIARIRALRTYADSKILPLSDPNYFKIVSPS
jgi:hypothetical protein